MGWPLCVGSCVCVFGGGLSTDYLLPEVGRVEPRWGNLQAGAIGGAFLKGSRMAKLNVSTVSTPPGAENPWSPQMSTGIGATENYLFPQWYFGHAVIHGYCFHFDLLCKLNYYGVLQCIFFSLSNQSLWFVDVVFSPGLPSFEVLVVINYLGISCLNHMKPNL